MIANTGDQREAKILKRCIQVELNCLTKTNYSLLIELFI